jgi:hypothetical protein
MTGPRDHHLGRGHPPLPPTRSRAWLDDPSTFIDDTQRNPSQPQLPPAPPGSAGGAGLVKNKADPQPGDPAPAANRPAGHIAGDLLSRQQSSVLAGRRCCAFPIRRQATMDRPTLIGPEALHRPAAETPGVDRREAFADDHVWAGRSRTEAGTWSGWHVHPGHDTYVFQTEAAFDWSSAPAAPRASRADRATSCSSPRAWSTGRGIPAPKRTKPSSFEWARAKSWSTSTAPDRPAPPVGAVCSSCLSCYSR